MILNVVSLLAPDGLVWVLHKLLIYWDFPHTAISRVYRERSEKGNIPRERSSLEENATIAVSENTDSWIILSLVWDSVNCHKIFQYCCKHGVPNNLSRFMNSKGLRQETKDLSSSHFLCLTVFPLIHCHFSHFVGFCGFWWLKLLLIMLFT